MDAWQVVRLSPVLSVPDQAIRPEISRSFRIRSDLFSGRPGGCSMSESGSDPHPLGSLREALDERTFRLVAAAAAQVLGHGGVKRVAEATDLARSTITRGLREISAMQAA